MNPARGSRPGSDRGFICWIVTSLHNASSRPRPEACQGGHCNRRLLTQRYRRNSRAKSPADSCPNRMCFVGLHLADRTFRPLSLQSLSTGDFHASHRHPMQHQHGHLLMKSCRHRGTISPVRLDALRCACQNPFPQAGTPAPPETCETASGSFYGLKILLRSSARLLVALSATSVAPLSAWPA